MAGPMSGRAARGAGRLDQRSGGNRGRVTFGGPFWQADAIDVWNGNVSGWLAELAAQGEDHAKQAFSGITKSEHFIPGIVGRVRSIKGNRWWLTAVVSAQYVYPWGRSIGNYGYYTRKQRKRLTAVERMAFGGPSKYRTVDKVQFGYKGPRGFRGRAQSEYRGGKLERKYHGFRTTAAWLKGRVQDRSNDMVKGLEG